MVTCAAAVTVALATGCGESGDGDGSTTSSPTSPVAGGWTGRLHQRGLPAFTVTARIVSPTGSAGNEVHYTGIDCSGQWTYLDSDGATFRFREVIDRGRGGKCKGVGVVALSPEQSGKRLEYEFRGGGVVSRGTLHRPDAN
jgi:hypothetical protein